MMKFLIHLIIILTIFSCQKDIEIEPKSAYQEQLFIEGILYPGKVPRIFLSRALPFFQSEVTPQEVFARDAVVTLTNKETEYTLFPFWLHGHT